MQPSFVQLLKHHHLFCYNCSEKGLLQASFLIPKKDFLVPQKDNFLLLAPAEHVCCRSSLLLSVAASSSAFCAQFSTPAWMAPPEVRASCVVVQQPFPAGHFPWPSSACLLWAPHAAAQVLTLRALTFPVSELLRKSSTHPSSPSAHLMSFVMPHSCWYFQG